MQHCSVLGAVPSDWRTVPAAGAADLGPSEAELLQLLPDKRIPFLLRLPGVSTQVWTALLLLLQAAARMVALLLSLPQLLFLLFAALLLQVVPDLLLVEARQGVTICMVHGQHLGWMGMTSVLLLLLTCVIILLLLGDLPGQLQQRQ